MASGKAVMQPEEFRLFKEFVAEVFGLVLEEGGEKYLSMKLLSRLKELQLRSFAEYYDYLKFAPGCLAERQQFIPLITNNETYFFREEAQLKVLREEILPRLLEQKRAKGERILRIVSAGCSSGEEVYTLAMLLHESGSFVWDWDVRIIGVDVDPRVLDRARVGVYGERSFRTTSPQLRERYFKESGDRFAVRDLLRKSTTFLEGNLLDLKSVLPERDIDVVFCRNVLIYFGDETTKRVLDNLSRLMVPGGWLFLGHSESLSRISTPYLPLRFPGAIIYKGRE
jgi:chemotaxis protein methyltransferase CheR